MLRTHDCGALRAEHVGRPVRLAGWVATVRDHGGVVFVDLRDRYGRTQAVVSPETQPALAAAARALGAEYVVQVAGPVRARAPEARNPRMATGDVEVAVESLVVLSSARTPPFEIDTADELDFALRMRHRALDLRRAEPKRLLELRSAVVDHIRRHLTDRGYLEIETPVLFKSTPEGAREFLVPSRLNHGKFYALPQSPQQFKQLLMVAGLDRYFQIARCFRDEDPRVDRQWEFTQLDLEASFVERDDVLQVIEALYLELWDRFAPGQRLVARPFPRLAYAEAMRRFGTDKPDLRYGCEHHDVTALFSESGPAPLREVAARGGEVRALAVPARGRLSRKKIDALEAVAKSAGAGGMGWLDGESDPPRGNVAKALAPGQVAALNQAVGRTGGDLILLVGGTGPVAAEAADAVRRAAAAELQLIPGGVASFAWIVDFPLFLRDPDDTRWVSSHHPFTAPQPQDLARLESDPRGVRSWQYDLTCNGYEIAGGSIRIHDPAVQQRVFGVLGLSPEQQQRLFGHLLEAFSYGTPPHGGIAAGVDRLVALLAGTPAIREVIAFPKTARGQDLMSGAPSPVASTQLAELGIALAPSSPAPPAAEAGGDSHP